MRRLLLVVLLRIRAGILVLIVLLIVRNTHSTTITSVVRVVAILMQTLAWRGHACQGAAAKSWRGYAGERAAANAWRGHGSKGAATHAWRCYTSQGATTKSCRGWASERPEVLRNAENVLWTARNVMFFSRPLWHCNATSTSEIVKCIRDSGACGTSHIK